mgnify:CR=1 FL=1
MEIDKLLNEVNTEINRAMALYPKFNSTHEGYAVILEELDEVWEEVKKSKVSHGNESMRKELIQVAAMALRFINDLC